MLTLRNGIKIPCVGLGTFKAKGEEIQAAVKWAWDAGIRHIDTASIYKVRNGMIQQLRIVVLKSSPFRGTSAPSAVLARYRKEK